MTCTPGKSTIRRVLQLRSLYAPPNSLDHEDLPLRNEGNVHDRREVQLRRLRSFLQCGSQKASVI